LSKFSNFQIIINRSQRISAFSVNALSVDVRAAAILLEIQIFADTY